MKLPSPIARSQALGQGKSKMRPALGENPVIRSSDRGSIPLASTIPDHHLMKVKWGSFLIFKGMYFICKTENIKNIEGYIIILFLHLIVILLLKHYYKILFIMVERVQKVLVQKLFSKKFF